MTDKSVAQKMSVKPGNTVVVLDAPKWYFDKLVRMPEGAVVSKELVKDADIIQYFAMSMKQLEVRLAELRESLKEGGILWISYPKESSKLKTDLNRDKIRERALKKGLDAVTIFAIDDDWACVRLKKV